jgi:hypothetical protein
LFCICSCNLSFSISWSHCPALIWAYSFLLVLSWLNGILFISACFVVAALAICDWNMAIWSRLALIYPKCCSSFSCWYTGYFSECLSCFAPSTSCPFLELSSHHFSQASSFMAWLFQD